MMPPIKKTEIIRITRMFSFDMAHALFGYDGPCKNIHGHTYHLCVTLKGKILDHESDPKNGMIMDFSALKEIVMRKVVNVFDHALVLNGKAKPHLELQSVLLEQFEKIIFLDRQPTCENLLVHFKEKLQSKINKTNGKLEYMKLSETPNSYAEWFVTDNV